MSAVTQQHTERLEEILRGLMAEHETLISLASKHREALRAADAPEMSRVAAQRSAVNARIVELDRQRAELVSELAQTLGMQGAGMTVRALIAAIGGQSAKQLSALAEKLRQLIEKARTEQAALRDATAAVAGHLGGVLTQVVRTCSVGQTYTARGKMAPGTSMPAAMDLRH